jgi:hypothetical protein
MFDRRFFYKLSYRSILFTCITLRAECYVLKKLLLYVPIVDTTYLDPLGCFVFMDYTNALDVPEVWCLV